MLRSPGTRHTPKARRIWERLGGTSTSSSVECRGVAHLRYALRTRGGCSYQATIPEGATVSGNAARMATPGRDEHQLVRGVPGCSAPALRPSHPGRVLVPSYDSRGRDGFRKRGAHGNAWEGRAPARPRTTRV